MEQMPQAQPPAEPAAPAPAEQAAPQGNPQYKTKVIEAVPDNLKPAFERIVMAGLKLIYSKQMAGELKRVLESPEPMEKKMAEGIAMVMRLLDSQAKKGLPQELIIPAAIELLYDVADFVRQTGNGEVTEEQLHWATQYTTVLIAKMYGAQDSEIQGVFAGESAQPQGAQDGVQPQ